MRYIGIDPGQSGGIAVIDEDYGHGDGIVEAWKQPETEHDVADLLLEIKAGRVVMATIEIVHSFPGQGVSSTFKFGQNYGFLRGLLVGMQIPFQSITPQKWQKEMQCLTHGDKNVSKARAQELWPHLKITHATADSLLIAEAARRLSK